MDIIRSASLEDKRLRGSKGGPRCDWALANLRNAGEVLFFLNLLEPVAISEKAKKGMFKNKEIRIQVMRKEDFDIVCDKHHPAPEVLMS